MKSMCKHWGLHISTDTNRLEVVLSSFWAVWRGLLMSLEQKLISWWFSRYWRFNKWYHGGYQLICLISRPLVIALRCDWYQSKVFLRAFCSRWDHENCQRIDGDMAEWSLWQSTWGINISLSLILDVFEYWMTMAKQWPITYRPYV